MCRVVSSTTFFSLSLFLRCWGNPNLLGVWDSPCVPSSLTRIPASTRSSSFSPSPRPCPAPACFCLFLLVSVVVFLVWVFSGCSGWFVILGGWLSGGGFLHALGDSINASVGRCRRTRHPSPLSGLLLRFCFWGNGWGPISRVSTRHTDSVSPPPPPFLQNAVKDSPGRRWVHGNRTVTQCRVLVSDFSPFRRGKCCPFFSLCVFVSGSVSFAFFFAVLLRVALKNFSGANFCFWVSLLVLCFWWCFA